MRKTNAEYQAANRAKKNREGWWRPWIRPEYVERIKALLKELEKYKG